MHTHVMCIQIPGRMQKGNMSLHGWKEQSPDLLGKLPWVREHLVQGIAGESHWDMYWYGIMIIIIGGSV